MKNKGIRKREQGGKQTEYHVRLAKRSQPGVC